MMVELHIDTVINNTSFILLSVSGPSICYSNITLVSSLNVSGPTRINEITTLNDATTCLSSINVSGITTLNNVANINGKLNVRASTPAMIRAETMTTI
jgi:hypothetical protein